MSLHEERQQNCPLWRWHLAEQHSAADRCLSARRQSKRHLTERRHDAAGYFAEWRLAGRHHGAADVSMRDASLSETFLLAGALLRGVSLSGTSLLAGASHIF